MLPVVLPRLVSACPASGQVLSKPGCNLTCDKGPAWLKRSLSSVQTNACRVHRNVCLACYAMCAQSPHGDARLLFYRYLQRGLDICWVLLLFRFLSAGKTWRNLLKCITCRSEPLFESHRLISTHVWQQICWDTQIELPGLFLTESPHAAWRPFQIVAYDMAACT